MCWLNVFRFRVCVCVCVCAVGTAHQIHVDSNFCLHPPPLTHTCTGKRARHITVQHGTARYSKEQHGTATYSKVQQDTARNSKAQHRTSPHTTAHHHMSESCWATYSIIMCGAHDNHVTFSGSGVVDKSTFTQRETNCKPRAHTTVQHKEHQRTSRYSTAQHLLSGGHRNGVCWSGRRDGRG